MGSKVCFVVTELLGTVRNGGIATATTHASLILAREGHAVELLYCGPEVVMVPRWLDRYREGGVLVTELDRSLAVFPEFIADSYRLYQQLKGADHDVIVFQDWQGLGFCSLVAKDAGLAFQSTRMVHFAHGPGDWLRAANRQLAVDAFEFAQAHMERTSAALADTIVSPSQYLIDWMLEAGWPLPADRHVIPLFTATDLDPLASSNAAPSDPPPAPLREIVFFGRLERRKGVQVFVDALRRLGPVSLSGLDVAFLGREATFNVEAVTAMLPDDLVAALGNVRFHTDLDQPEALAYLRRPGCLAVMPSLLDNSPNVIYECIEARVSFLASSAGGIGELVAPEDRDRVLFAPNGVSLTEALGDVVDSGVTPRPPRAGYDRGASLAAWRRVLEPLHTTAAPSAARPSVTVVVAHHNQGRLLVGAVESLVAQDYPDVEVLVVDDGSTDPMSLAVLDDLDRRAWDRTVRVIRQENRYLGAARNTGLREATGELVVFCDDDDFVDATFVPWLVTAIETTNAAAVSCAIRAIEANDAGEIPSDPDMAVWAFLGGEAVELGTVVNVFGGAAMIVRPDVVKAVGGFHETHGVGHEDWELLARLALAGHRVVAIPEAPYRYRVRPTSMVRTTTTWQNMAPVFASYAALLPPALSGWPALIRGLQDRLDAVAGLPALPPPPSWWRRDLTLLRRYLDRGGLRLVVARSTSRVRRLARGRAGRTRDRAM